MKANRERVIAWVGLSEGGLVDHPLDPGGRTNMGITQKTYTAWLRSHKRPVQAVDHITKTEADEIVGAQYLDPVRFDDLPAGLDYSVADFAVNSGPARAVKELQKMVGVAQDGIMGAQTLAAIGRASIPELIGAYNDRRLAFMKSLKTWRTFGRGWSARVADVRARSLEMYRGQSILPRSTPPVAEKASDDKIRATNLLGKVLEDPIAIIPAAGTIITPLVNSSGPLAWAIAALVLIAGAVVAVRALKRGL